MDLPVTLLNAFNSSFSTTIFESEYLKTHRLFSASSHTNHHILFGSSKTDWKSSRKLLNYCRRFFIYTSCHEHWNCRCWSFTAFTITLMVNLVLTLGFYLISYDHTSPMHCTMYYDVLLNQEKTLNQNLGGYFFKWRTVLYFFLKTGKRYRPNSFCIVIYE